jgi:CBS domain-containing membrane protein
MTREVDTVEPDASIDEAGLIMMENKFGCIPVCQGTHLVGILTESDFVHYVVALATQETEHPIPFRRVR